MGVDEIQAGRRPPMSEQPWLDVLKGQRLAQERVIQQIDLANRQVARRAPITIKEFQLALNRRCRPVVARGAGRQRCRRLLGWRSLMAENGRRRRASSR